MQKSDSWLLPSLRSTGGRSALAGAVRKDFSAFFIEKHMQNHVDTYVCEWKDVVEDPEKRKRFQHFVNAKGDGSNLAFVDVRGQKVPAAWI